MNAAQQNMSSLIQNDDVFQQKLTSFIKNLSDLGLNQEQVETIAGNISVTATEQTIAKISALMDDDDFNKWKAFMDTGPNTAQQLIVLNKFLMDKSNKDLEAINNEIIDSLLKDTLVEVSKMKDLNTKISQLSPEEVAKAKALIDAGDYEGAEKVVNKE